MCEFVLLAFLTPCHPPPLSSIHRPCRLSSSVKQKLRDAQQHKTGSNKRKMAVLQQEVEGRIAQKEQELLAKRPRGDGSWQKLQAMLGMLE